MDALHAASTDERVKGVIAHIGSTQNFSGLAQIQELRDAVMKFRSGFIIVSSCLRYCLTSAASACCSFLLTVFLFREKTQGRAATVAYADAFGEAGGFGTMSYYLASGFEKVGLCLQCPDSLGVLPEQTLAGGAQVCYTWCMV